LDPACDAEHSESFFTKDSQIKTRCTRFSSSNHEAYENAFKLWFERLKISFCL